MASNKFSDNRQDILLGQSVQDQVSRIDENFKAIVSSEDDLQEQINNKEPKITKNNAFNKSFSAANPLMDGTANPGTSDSVARGDHKHPTDTSRLAVAPNGSDNLIVSGKINEKYIPDSVLGQVEYRGTWDASTGTVTGVASGYTKRKGDYFICTKGGNKNPTETTVGSNTYAVGDWAIYNGTSWDKVDNTDAVTSVNNRIGDVKTYQGAWDTNTQYYAGDQVLYGGYAYLAVANSLSQNPASTSGYWVIFGAVQEVNGQKGVVKTYKKAYSSAATYHAGDIVLGTDGCLYLYINDTAASGKALTDSTSWKIFGKTYSNATTSAAGLMSAADKTNLDANTSARHTHSNKALLDTYDQTNANIKDAVTKKHSHSNKSILDATTASYTTAEKTKLGKIDDSLLGVTADQIGKVKDVTVNGASVLGTDGVAAISIADLAAGYVDITTTDSAWTTQTINGTTYQAIRVAKTNTALGVFNSSGQEMVVQKVYDDSYLYLCVGTAKVACTVRKLSGGAVGTGGDPKKYYKHYVIGKLLYNGINYSMNFYITNSSSVPFSNSNVPEADNIPAQMITEDEVNEGIGVGILVIIDSQTRAIGYYGITFLHQTSGGRNEWVDQDNVMIFPGLTETVILDIIRDTVTEL